MSRTDKVILGILVSTNAFTIALWFYNGVINAVMDLFGNPYTEMFGIPALVIAVFAILAGLSIDLFMFGMLSKKEHNITKFVAPIVLSVVSALIAYHFFNGSFLSYHFGHLLHSMWAFLPIFYMLYFAETVSRADRLAQAQKREDEKQAKKLEEQERADKEHAANMRAQGKEQCPFCAGWYQSGNGIKRHLQRCAKRQQTTTTRQ